MHGACLSSPDTVSDMSTPADLIKAVSIDINWNMLVRPASPGLYAHADPRAQVRWCHDLGANTMQTFCCSFNGFAWFPSEVAPVTPGLVGNFLQEQVEEGHRLGMKVMGYFCLGSNAFWAMNHGTETWHDTKSVFWQPDAVRRTDWKDISWNWIPFTEEYLDYFCACVQDALRKTDMDGFMIDWFKVERSPLWLDNEKQMWGELMGEKFPSHSAPSPAAEIEFKRRQVERAWVRVREAVRGVRPAVIWTNHPFDKADDPLWNGHRLLKEVDWLLNEAPGTGFLDWLEKNVGAHTRILQNFCGWPDHSAGGWRDLDTRRFGLYGFTTVNPGTCLPWTLPEIEALRRPVMAAGQVSDHYPNMLGRLAADARNVAILREAYHAIGRVRPEPAGAAEPGDEEVGPV